jgi:hypothetical protein
MTVASVAKPYQFVKPDPPVVTHHGPFGPVRACRWYGTTHDGSLGFLRTGGTVAYRVEGFTPNQRLVIDLDDGQGEETARPGDWLVWRGGECRVVSAAVFRLWYRPGGVS